MQLYYTPRSHFSRKVRILLAALGLDATLIDAGNVGDADTAAFGPNPLMKVPTLVDGHRTLFDSDHIAQYLVVRHDPGDRFGVLTRDPDALNARAVMNGVMATEVELILAERSGIDTRGLPRFDKMRQSIDAGLAWLEQHADAFPAQPCYLAFHLVAMWDHLALYGLRPLGYPRLSGLVARTSAHACVAASKPG